MTENIDCSDYENCPAEKEITTKLDYDNLNLIFFGCWGVYCRTNVVKELMYSWDNEKNKGKIITKETKYGGNDVSNLLQEYSEKYRVDAVILAGDNVYEDTITGEDILDKYKYILDETDQKKFKKQLKKMKIKLHNIEKQIKTGFEKCIKKVKTDTFLVGIGNHDIKTCDILNYELNYKGWTLPGLYYNYRYLLSDTTIVNLIFIDTNIYDNEYCSKDEKYDTKFFDYAIQKQKTWLTKILTNNKENWNIIIGHNPFISATHSKEDNVNFLVDTRLRKDINELALYIDLYMCADEHNQQYLIYYPNGNKKNSIPIVISGTGGAPLDKNIKPIPKEENDNVKTIFTRANFGFVSLNITKDNIKMDFHSVNPVDIVNKKR